MQEGEKDVIMKMEMLENVISQLYKKYAERFSQDRQFWAQLSLEEVGHAKWVKELGEQSKKKNLTFDKGRFKVNAIQTTIEYIQKKIKQATSDLITEKEAFYIAWDIENGLLEKEFFKTFESDQLELKKILEKLLRETKDHRYRIGLKKDLD